MSTTLRALACAAHGGVGDDSPVPRGRCAGSGGGTGQGLVSISFGSTCGGAVSTPRRNPHLLIAHVHAGSACSCCHSCCRRRGLFHGRGPRPPPSGRSCRCRRLNKRLPRFSFLWCDSPVRPATASITATAAATGCDWVRGGRSRRGGSYGRRTSGGGRSPRREHLPAPRRHFRRGC
ncbi:unnamed protein product [Ectocarpus sp. 12 AP-2014]